jgi:hypothetical protein
MKESYGVNSSGLHARRDLQGYTHRRKAAAELESRLRSGDEAAIMNLLPTRDIADRQVNLYIKTFETTYRILHVPTFMEEYNKYWDDPQNARRGFVRLLFVVIASVSCLCPRETTSYVGDSSQEREKAIRLIDSSDSWLEKQSLKHPDLTIFQIRCLSLIAKQMNQIEMKAYYTYAGTLLRSGVTAGLHRDPDLMSKNPSSFDKEMRRRIFATMLELELQASIDRGLPSMSTSIPFDCCAPSNLNDSDFGPACESLPPPRPSEEFTDGSYLNLSRRSIALRIHINALVNDQTSPMRYQDILPLHNKVMQQLEDLPRWSDAYNTSFAQTLLDIQIRQNLLLLHAPFAQRKTYSSCHEYSRTICLNAASSLINQHNQLTESGNFVPTMLRHDILRAALSISHNVFLLTNNPSKNKQLPKLSFPPLLPLD